MSCVEAGNHNQKPDDEWQLRFAISQRRVILTHNSGDYILLDHRWREQGEQHFGIILAVNATPIGELVRRTRNHLEMIDAEQHRDVIIWLG